MRAVAEGCMHECFSHSEEGVFDVTRMRAWAARNLVPVQIDISDYAQHIRSSRVIEDTRVDSLTEIECASDPAIFVMFMRPGEETTHLMIDGHHRTIRLLKEGKTEQLAYIFTEAQIIRPPEGFDMPLDWGDADLVGDQLVKRG